MEDVSWREEIATRVWLAQVVVGALLGGVLAFLAVAVVIQSAAPYRADMAPLLTLTLLAFTVGAVAAGIIAPQVMASQGRRKIREGTWQMPQTSAAQAGLREMLERTGDAGKLWLVFMGRTIIAAAIPEGIAFFACVTYLVERSLVGLAVAVIMAMWIALQIPTQASAIGWIERQLQRIEEERLLAR